MSEVLLPTKPVEYFYDLDLQKTVLMGGAALMGALASPHSEYIEELMDRGRLAVAAEGEHATDLADEILIEPERLAKLFPLGRLLKDEGIEIVPVPTHAFQGISAQRCLAYGKWIYEQAARHDPETLLDISLIDRAHRLGLGPSVKQLTDRFSNLTRYYQELEIAKTLRKNQFDEWPNQRLVKYLASIGTAPHKLPRMRYIDALSKTNVHKPSFNVFEKRFQGLNPALELAGYWVIPNWDDEDYIEWGLQFASANNGRPPMMRQIYSLSKNGLGPSSSITALHFGSISNFQRKVKERYAQHEAERVEMVESLKSSYKGNPEIFNGSIKDNDEERSLKQHARYALISSLPVFMHLPYEMKTRLCRRVEDLDFIPTLANLNSSLTVADIKQTAREIGVYSFVSSMRHHRDLLQAPS